MNIQNISALAGQLKSLGFDDPGCSLLKRICFKPKSFFISQKIENGKDRITFQLFFEKSNNQNAYALMYYDAILQKEITITDTTINGISSRDLEKQMTSIDWKNAFELDEKRQWSIDDKASWEKEQKIEAIVNDLNTLEELEEGKAVGIILRLKYWPDINHPELVGNVSFLKNKSEVNQRFYFFDGQPGISVDEAYRFLQNQWLEKQMQIKRKQNENSESKDDDINSKNSFGSGLLKKRRLGNSKSIKSGKRFQS